MDDRFISIEVDRDQFSFNTDVEAGSLLKSGNYVLDNLENQSCLQNAGSNGYQRRIRRLIKVSILLTLLASPLSVYSQENVGYVLSIAGNWYLNGVKQPVKRFQKLAGGARLTARKPIKKPTSLAIAIFNGETIRRECDSVSSCGKTIVLPKSIKPVSSKESGPANPSARAEVTMTQRIGNAFRSLFEHPAAYFVPTLARGEDSNLHEAVVELNAGEVSLGQVFNKMPRGIYLIDVEALVFDEQRTMRLKPVYVEIDWDPRVPTQVTTHKLEPGLYRLLGRAKYQAWVLVVSPEEYKAANDSFQYAVETTLQWGNAVDEESARMFLRAYLANLSKQVQ